MLKTGIQYLPADSIEKEEKRACLYSVRPFVSVMPMQAKIQVLWTSRPQQFLRKILNIKFLLRKYLQCWQGLVIRRNRVNFGRDKFTGYLFAPFIDALTDDRHHIVIRGCRYTAPPLTSSGSVVCRYLQEEDNTKKSERTMEFKVFHNPIGAFRRKVDL